MFYVSDSHQLSSLFAEGDDYAIQELRKNYSTAIDTRSLSVSLITGSNPTIASQNTTTNLALLYYENPSGNVSVLLKRTNFMNSVGHFSRSPYQWLDISSQSSQSLPDEFRNKGSTDVWGSHTLYETDPDIILGPPFTSMGNSSLLYAPSRASLEVFDYSYGPGGFDIFSSGMHCASSSSERLLTG